MFGVLSKHFYSVAMAEAFKDLYLLANFQYSAGAMAQSMQLFGRSFLVVL
ncbi:hypothetical protein NZD89_08660 [Alicyclobacillus fastidiosus]|uniref:Uncharacterized protein n=1 Tax=Alicyclobacillus fastidiosus TaxID=392011 RepID=A0ABY6ZMW1_9BACL|nr:hypothetical protein [Alicyclobacillus fastidiosus]WAH43439.1 hypothetical protein NZD89_08660 [Alicyclobacillus fastidiosus]